MKVLMKLSILLILSAIFLSTGCQEQHNMQKLQDQVDAINDQMITAILNNDAESTLALYKEDAISLPSYQPMMKGMDAFKEQMEKQKEMPMNFQTFTLTSTDLLVSGKFVVDVGTYDLSMDYADAPDGVMKDNGKYLTLFEIQQDGSLLIKVDTWNTDLNPWEAMMANQEEEKK